MIETPILAHQLFDIIHHKIFKRTGEDPKAVKFDEEEIITFNHEFANPKKRLIIVPKPMKRAATKIDKVEEELLFQRNQVIDATMVRIMKQRRTQMHNELITETLKFITLFKPKIGDLKKRIESLIENEYIKRDENKAGNYIYIP